MRRAEYAMLRYPAGGYYLLIRYPSSPITVWLVNRPKWTDNESLDDSITEQKQRSVTEAATLSGGRLTGPYCISKAKQWIDIRIK